MFSKRKRAEALIAQSLYEPLTDTEHNELDALLRAMPDLAAEADAQRAFVDRVPLSDEPFEGDLRPAVMASLHQRPTRRWPIVPHWAIALAAFLVVASGVAYRIVVNPPAAVAPAPTTAATPASSVYAALEDADRLTESREHARAYARLAAAVDANPNDLAAPEACQRMADIAFVELEWYPEAFAGYDALRHRYVDQFRAVPTNFTRLNLLDETRGPDNQYASLRALNAAARGDNFDSLEDIVSRRPASYLASAASVEMSRIVAKEFGRVPGQDPVEDMRLAVVRSKSPVAKSQLRLEVAHMLATTPDGSQRAREIYEEIANGGITTLAEAAQKSLENLDAATPADPAF